MAKQLYCSPLEVLINTCYQNEVVEQDDSLHYAHERLYLMGEVQEHLYEDEQVARICPEGERPGSLNKCQYDVEVDTSTCEKADSCPLSKSVVG
ncbi:hypothetical protein BHM03_00034019 [Ensete ventricosum]|nr:hypothetical protein BHM03_00034019 [Ensete ventricosum]